MNTKFETFKEMLELSFDEKCGLTVFFGSQIVAGVVVKINEKQSIEMRSREFSRIIVSIEAINAIAVS